MMGSTLCGDCNGFHPLEHASCGRLSRRQRPQLVERDARVLVWSAIARRGNREPYDCGVLGASQHGRRPAGSTEFFARVLRPEGACDEDRPPCGVFGGDRSGVDGRAWRRFASWRWRVRRTACSAGGRAARPARRVALCLRVRRPIRGALPRAEVGHVCHPLVHDYVWNIGGLDVADIRTRGCPKVRFVGDGARSAR